MAIRWISSPSPSLWTLVSDPSLLDASSSEVSEVSRSSGGRIGTSEFVLGMKCKNSRGSNRIKFRITNASHKYLKFDRVTPSTLSNTPPAHADESKPMLSTDIRKAKNVPSIPGAQILAARTSNGNHLMRLVPCIHCRCETPQTGHMRYTYMIYVFSFKEYQFKLRND